MKQKIRQCLSLLLVLAMCVSQIPMNALAAGMDSRETENVIEEANDIILDEKEMYETNSIEEVSECETNSTEEISECETDLTEETSVSETTSDSLLFDESDSLSKTEELSDKTEIASDNEHFTLFAEEIQPDETGVTRAEWLSSLTEVFEMHVDSDEYPDNYFSDLSDEADYYYDLLLAVQFGLVDVEEGNPIYPDDAATREFAAHTLNFCLGYQLDENVAYTFTDSSELIYPDDAQVMVDSGLITLVNGEFCPEQAITSTEAERMLAYAEDVWHSTDIDESHFDSYELSDSVIEIPEDTEVSIDNDIITIVDCPVSITKGKWFSVVMNGIPCVYSADNVITEDNKLLITVTAVDSSQAFENIDIQGEIEADLSLAEALDGTQIDAIETPETASAQYAMARAAVKLPSSIKSTTKIEKGAVSGTATVKITNPTITYNIVSADHTASAKISGSAEVTWSLNFDAAKMGGETDEVRFINFTVPGVGGFVVALDFKVEGSLSGTFKGYFSEGIQYGYGGTGFRMVNNFSASTFTINSEIAVELGLKAKLGLTDLPVLKGYLYAKMGVKASKKTVNYTDNLEPKKCQEFSAHFYASCGATASVKFFGVASKSYSYDVKIFDSSNSPLRVIHHYEDGVLIPSCTRDTTGSVFKKYQTSGTSRLAGSGLLSSNYGYDSNGNIIQLYRYTLDADNNATITGYNGGATSLIIPSQIDGYTVVAIGGSAFKGNTKLRLVVIPDTVTSIGGEAFSGCTMLCYANLSKSLVFLGNWAFRNCVSLTTINVPKTLTTVETVGANNRYPFIGCTKLKNIVFDEGITAIPGNLFAGCTGIETVIIPDTVTSIGGNSFKGCSNLKTLELSKNLTSMSSAFQNCTSLTHVRIPKLLANTNSSPFGGCTSLSMIEFEEGITQIPESLFSNCTGLEIISIPDTVTSIYGYAFSECTNLKTVEIPDSVISINGYAFNGCTALVNIRLPNKLKAIGSHAFRNCISISTINVPKTLTNVDTTGWNWNYPFTGCSGITSITFDEGATQVPSYLFGNCTADSLELVIPEGIVSIGSRAFIGCSNLISVTFPESLTSIGDLAFANTGLKEINISDNITSFSDSVFKGCTKLTSVQWNNTLRTIPSSTFENCTGLDSFTLTSSITKIDGSAFKGCSSLNEIKWNDVITTINGSVFSNCSALTNINIPNTVTTIGNQAFYNCDALTKVIIPDSVTSFGTSMFYDCDALTDVTLGTGLTSIPNSTFEHCDALESIVLPYRVASIGASAFKNDVALKSIFIPRATSTIDSTAFSYPDKMTIYGVAGTYAETFANTNGYTFVDQSVPATAVKLTPSEVTINKGQSTNLTMTVTPENFTDEVSWKSTDTSIATISDTGVVKGVAVGTATIKLMVGDVSANCKVTVVQPVTSISLNKTSLTMEALDTYQLIATANPNTAANRDIVWSTSDESIVAVDETGLVTAFGKGSATITATAADGSGVTKSCTVTVTNTAHIAATVDEMESAHNYPNSCSDFWVYTLAGAEKLSVTFDTRTNIEEDFDFLYIYDVEGNQIGKYTGTALAGQTVEVPGDTVRIKLVSDSSGTAWGFKVSSIRKPAIVLANGTCGENMTWTMYEDGLLTINGTGDMKTYTYTREVPWYSYIGQITSVQIEEGVTSISSFAFYGITGLREIMIPEGVKTLGAYAFKNSTALESVGLPTTLSKIGESAFYGCTNLKTIAIPEGIYTIWAYTFKNCTSLASVTLPQSLIKIDEAAFYGCSSLAELLIPDSVSIIGIYAFKNCSKLKELTLPANLTEVREAAFYATAMETLNIPSGVTKIGPYAFKNCTALSSLNLPEHLTSIGEAAFYASSIETLTVPDAVTKIGPYAFKNCAQLKNVTLPASLEAISESCFYSCTALETIALPDNVTVVGNYAFRKCTSLKHVSFPKRLNIVGESSFYGCTALTEISLSEGVTSILSYAFKGCTSLASVTLPGTLKRIGGSAFHSCTILGGITIPANVTEISGYCFSGNIKLREITFEGSAPAFGTDVFKNVTAKAYYPSIDSSWTDAVKQNYGGNITWLAK